ncbi:gamma-glutamyl-gamma-aminobutyrate hydrolase family protein, partial [Streptomyces olivaceoviridis]
EDDEDDHESQGDVPRAVHCGPPVGSSGVVGSAVVSRGLQVVNTALGGTLHQDMGGSGREHRHVRHPVSIAPGSALAQVTGVDKAEASCYHHQHVDRLGEGLTVTARAADGTVEAVELAGGGPLLAVQWHPEDTAHEDPVQQRLFDALVRAARAMV